MKTASLPSNIIGGQPSPKKSATSAQAQPRSLTAKTAIKVANTLIKPYIHTAKDENKQPQNNSFAENFVKIFSCTPKPQPRLVEQKINHQTATHLARQQIFLESCGAACLLCAAKELGVEKIPQLKGSRSKSLGIDTLELDDRCEADIYTITSGLDTYKNRHKDLSNAGASMPDGIVTAARVLGLQASVVEKRNIFSLLLNRLYPDVKKILRGSGCQIKHHEEPLKDKQLSIEVLVAFSPREKVLNLHWVLHRSDGSYMDPNTGENYSDFKSLNKAYKSDSKDKLARYIKTGISVIVERPNKTL